NIARVHLLKLDIQGAEKLALAGARPMLESADIDCIYLEVHFSQVYTEQTTFGEIETVLKNHGYHLYGFYELTREGNGCLDFCNALYLSSPRYRSTDQHYLF
ncbi:MAG: FkbM family methyltransferase, partial [Planctomycetia bacterium]|nr:FkbM family methyltransferase [Planctomycetia bacterium]